MKRLMDRSTCVLVGSAPSFPHGILDDLPALSELALEYGCGLHVDSCLGGMILPFTSDAGFGDFGVSFAIAGVTSISCDLHK